MTKRDFFILILKLFGLYAVITALFSVLPSNLLFALSDPDAFGVIWIVLVFVVIIGLFVLLIFKSDTIVRLLKLDQGFDDEQIDLSKINASGLVQIAVFIIGGVLIIDNIPLFLSHLLFSFKRDMSGIPDDSHSGFYWLVSTIKIVLGFVLITNYKFIAGLLRADKTGEPE